MNIICRDFNPKIVNGRVENIVGNYELGRRNAKGNKLVLFCQETEMVITNTWFASPPRRLYTWTSPHHDGQNIIRNQIDFILINKRFRNSLMSAKIYPETVIRPDYNPVIIEMKLKCKKIMKPKEVHLDMTKLRDPVYKRT